MGIRRIYRKFIVVILCNGSDVLRAIIKPGFKGTGAYSLSTFFIIKFYSVG